MKKIVTITKSITLVAILTSCTTSEKDNAGTTRSTGIPVGDEQIVKFSNITESIGSGSWKNVFWLNFEGATVTARESFIVENAGLNETQIPKFNPQSFGELNGKSRQEVIDEITSNIATIYEGFEVSFTTIEPSSQVSIIHIGGSDFRANKGALGVAPLDIKNFSNFDIGYAFPETLSPTRGIDNIMILSVAISHEIGHSLGAGHIIKEEALMNPFVDTKNKRLLSGPTQNGDGFEDTAQILRENIGLIANRDTTNLPNIVELAQTTQGDVTQYSVYSPTNLANNPDLNLGLYTYTWEVNNKTFTGSNVRFVKQDRNGEISLTVSNGSISSTKNFSFDEL